MSKCGRINHNLPKQLCPYEKVLSFKSKIKEVMYVENSGKFQGIHNKYLWHIENEDNII